MESNLRNYPNPEHSSPPVEQDVIEVAMQNLEMVASLLEQDKNYAQADSEKAQNNEFVSDWFIS